MTAIIGSVPTREDTAGGRSFTLLSVSDVDQLIDLLSRPSTFTATIEAEHGVIDAHVQDGYGYLLYSGKAAFAYSWGLPKSPMVESEVGFPAGAGIPLSQFRAALADFVTTDGHLPTAVQWRDPDDWPE